MQIRSLARRDFLAASAAGLAGLSVGDSAIAKPGRDRETVRCGFVGVGGRGTALLKATLELEGVEVVAICDIDAGYRSRASETVEKEKSERPVQVDDWKRLLDRKDITAVIWALPCDLHYPMYRDALAAGKRAAGQCDQAVSRGHHRQAV